MFLRWALNWAAMDKDPMGCSASSSSEAVPAFWPNGRSDDVGLSLSLSPFPCPSRAPLPLPLGAPPSPSSSSDSSLPSSCSSSSSDSSPASAARVRCQGKVWAAHCCNDEYWSANLHGRTGAVKKQGLASSHCCFLRSRSSAYKGTFLPDRIKRQCLRRDHAHRCAPLREELLLARWG